MEAAGAFKLWRGPITERRGSVHLLGTCRMGNDPALTIEALAFRAARHIGECARRNEI